MPEKATLILELERRVKELEQALKAARGVTDVERKSADLARESAARAWRIGIGTGFRRVMD